MPAATNAVHDALERFPVATLIHVIIAVVLSIDLLVDGNLSKDALTYAGILEGGNGLVAIGRGLKS